MKKRRLWVVESRKVKGRTWEAVEDGAWSSKHKARADCRYLRDSNPMLRFRVVSYEPSR